MSDMDDRIIGHRVGAGIARAGTWQFAPPTFSHAVIHVPENQRGEYLTVEWVPTVAGAILYYGFFQTADEAVSGFDLTSTTPTVPDPNAPTPMIARGPLWFERGEDFLTVPREHPFLRIEASTGSGRVAIATSDRELKAPDQ